MIKNKGLQLQNLPNIPELHNVLSGALAKRGTKMQVIWRMNVIIQFTLEVVCPLKGGDPEWTLFSERQKQRAIVCHYVSSDLLMVHNLISSACADLQQQTGGGSSMSSGRSVTSTGMTTELSRPREAPPQNGGSEAPPPGRQKKDSRVFYMGPGGAASSAGGQNAPAPPAQPPSPQPIAPTSQIGGEGEFPLSVSDEAFPRFRTQENLPIIEMDKPLTMPEHARPRPEEPNRPRPTAENNRPRTSEPERPRLTSEPARPRVTSEPPRVSSGRTIETAAAKPSAPAKPKFSFPLKGNLSQQPLSKLLRSINDARLTGKLEVSNSDTWSIVIFRFGAPVDATVLDTTGKEAIIEMLTWSDGDYKFEEGQFGNILTIHESSESLIQQSEMLARHLSHLTKNGLRPSSQLLPTNADVTKNDFVQRVTANAPCEIKTLIEFYRGLDGECRVEDMSKMMGVSRIQLTHIVYHLFSRDLIAIINNGRAEGLKLKPRPIDVAAIQTVMMSLRRADTGMFMHPAFLYFLEEEFFRSYRARSPFSIVLFEMREVVTSNGETKKRPLATQAIVEAALRMDQKKRHTDVMAHYDAFDYAFLLPGTKAAGTSVFINKIMRALKESPLAGIEPTRLSLAFGAASVPEDFTDLPSLLGAAELCMRRASDTEQSIILFRDIKGRVQLDTHA